ncbi:MAG: hypothetical protein ABIH03_17165, partial [Pseudomonadota bacterium]
MSSAWYQALMATAPRICGRRLLPFSLGHRFILRQRGSPYVCGGVAGWEDLLLAVQLCSRTFADCRSWLAGGARPRLLTLWAARWSRSDFAVADGDFRRYVDKFTRVPGHGGSPDGARRLSAPSEWHFALAVMRL